MRTHGSEELVQRRKQLVPQNYRFRSNDAPPRSKSKTVSRLKLTVLGKMTHQPQGTICKCGFQQLVT